MSFLQLPHFSIEANGVFFLGQHEYLRSQETLSIENPAHQKILIDEGIIVALPPPAPARTKSPVLFIEPHYDDIALSSAHALLSCRADGHAVHIATLFPHTALETFPWRAKIKLSPNEYRTLRQEEGAVAMRTYLGCVVHSFDEYGASLRGCKKPFGNYQAADKAVAERLLEGIDALIQQTRCERVFVPIGFGMHRDHRVAHEIGLALADRGQHIEFYEDQPYANNRFAFAATLSPQWQMHYRDCSQNLDTMANLITIYRSQFDDSTRSETLATLKQQARTVASEGRSCGEFGDAEFAERTRVLR